VKPADLAVLQSTKFVIGVDRLIVPNGYVAENLILSDHHDIRGFRKIRGRFPRDLGKARAMGPSFAARHMSLLALNGHADGFRDVGFQG
jgi:hypothetical protein